MKKITNISDLRLSYEDELKRIMEATNPFITKLIQIHKLTLTTRNQYENIQNTPNKIQ